MSVVLAPKQQKVSRKLPIESACWNMQERTKDFVVLMDDNTIEIRKRKDMEHVHFSRKMSDGSVRFKDRHGKSGRTFKRPAKKVRPSRKAPIKMQMHTHLSGGDTHISVAREPVKLVFTSVRQA